MILCLEESRNKMTDKKHMCENLENSKDSETFLLVKKKFSDSGCIAHIPENSIRKISRLSRKLHRGLADRIDNRFGLCHFFLKTVANEK